MVVIMAVVVFIMLLHLADAEGEDGGPGRGQVPADFTANAGEAVVAKESAIDERIVDMTPAVHMRAIVQSEAVQIPSAAEFQSTGKVFQFEKPFLEIAMPVSCTGILINVVGDEALEV